MAQTALVGALIAGLFGGLHCVAMCGGYVAALSNSDVGTRPLLPAAALWRAQLAAHAGRLCAYMALGLVFGGAGGAVLSASWGTAQRVLYAAANGLLLVLAVSVARGGAALAPLERAGLALFTRLLPAVPRLAARTGPGARFGLGLLWGITPCALVYAVLPVAMMSGSALDGALVMLAFGLGTLPNLALTGWIVGKARTLFRGRAPRLAAAALIAAFAMMGLWRAIFIPASLVHGPFCIVP